VRAVAEGTWPALPRTEWRDTYATLHMYTQIVGKICLALTPRTNHFWNIAFQVTPRGFATPTMTAGDRAFTIAFDFVAHQLVIHGSDGSTESIALAPRTVADFYRILMDTLRRMGIQVRIWPMPVEVPNPIRFTEDETHRSYNPEAAETLWRMYLAVKPVFDDFRCSFIGKCSPIHFFWGSFDLAVSRFSGRKAPERPGADSITRESYSHEVISHGFWLGSGSVQEPAFFAYAAPEPPGFKTASILPGEAFYSTDMSIFILPYEATRTRSAPAESLKTFLNTTYDAGASLAGWERAELERR